MTIHQDESNRAVACDCYCEYQGPGEYVVIHEPPCSEAQALEEALRSLIRACYACAHELYRNGAEASLYELDRLLWAVLAAQAALVRTGGGD